MLNWFLSTSVLIAVILLLRRVLRSKIDPRLTYALWLLAALRILIPVSFFSLPVSVATFTQESGLNEAVEQVRETVSPKSVLTTSIPADSDMTMEEIAESWSDRGLQVYEVRPYTEEELAEIRTENPSFYQNTDSRPLRMTVETLIGSRPFWNWVYLAGCFVTLIALSWSNRDFHKRMKRYRRPYEGELPVPCPVPVYVMPSLPSPCLYQMFRTGIYLNDAALNSDHLDHILTHEIVHYRHKDQWWVSVRIACLCVQWFNPLVWLAAYLSRQDCELACDASVIRILGEEQRLSYGKTLVDMIAAGRHPGAFLQPATTMTGGKKSITQRIQRIVKRPKMTAVTLVAVLLIAAVTAACAFGGATQKKDSQALDGYFGTTYVKAGESVVDHVQPIAVSYSPTKGSIGEITITENYFGAFEATGLDWGGNITNPVYKEVDFDPSAYGESDRFYPALDDFFGGYESITVYEIENASKPLHLLILDGELWMAMGVSSPTCYILRLEEYTAPPESGAPESEDTEPTPSDTALMEDVSELTWKFAPPSDNVTDTAFPITFAFDYDHYIARVDRGAGYIYSSDGTAFGLTLLEEIGTLYWIPYRDRDTSNTDTPTLTVSVYDKGDVTLLTATITFHLVEKTDSGTTYSVETSFYGNTDYICTKDPNTGGVRFVAAESVLSDSILTEEYLTSLVYPMEVSMRDDNSFIFDNPEELSTDQLYTLFLLLTDYEVLEQQYRPEEERFTFSVDFITAQLQKYFKSFRFDITAHEKYDAAADAIVTPTASGFGGDRYTKLVTASWVNNTTVTFTLWFYDNYEMTGAPYQAKTYTIEFYDGGCYYLSAVETALPVIVDAADLAESVYQSIAGDYDSRDCYMVIYDDTTGSITRIHLTEENSWNLPDTISQYAFPNPTGASRYEWAYASPDGADANFGVTLTSADGETWLRCWEGTDRVRLHTNGQDYFLTATVPEGRSNATLFDSLLRAADDALVLEAYDIVINGSVTDYETVVEEYARQFAARLNNLPLWASSRPENAVYRTSSVSQAYFGEGTENFCAGFGLYFSPEMGMSGWQAGSGMEEETEGEYAGWWKWGIGADFARNADGDWYCTGTYTGGVGLTYPTPLDEATMEELVHYFYHTYGDNHDYLIPYYICQQPVSALDELSRLLGEADVPHDLCAALGAFLREYGNYDDIQLTYEVLSAGLSSKYLPCLNEGYTGIPE